MIAQEEEGETLATVTLRVCQDKPVSESVVYLAELGAQLQALVGIVERRLVILLARISSADEAMSKVWDSPRSAPSVREDDVIVGVVQQRLGVVPIGSMSRRIKCRNGRRRT